MVAIAMLIVISAIMLYFYITNPYRIMSKAMKKLNYGYLCFGKNEAILKFKSDIEKSGKFASFEKKLVFSVIERKLNTVKGMDSEHYDINGDRDTDLFISKKAIETKDDNKKLFKCHFEVTKRDNSLKVIETRRTVKAFDDTEALNLGTDLECQFHNPESHIIKCVKIEETTLEKESADKQCRSNLKL
jgi:hypothetical protein